MSAVFTASFRSLRSSAVFTLLFNHSNRREQYSQSPPRPPIAREQIIRFFWAPGSGGIKEQIRRIFFCCPRLLDDVDESPGFLDFVATRKQRGIAAHRIEQQPFVRFRTGFAEGRPVMEIHLDWFDAETCARHFGLYPQ